MKSIQCGWRSFAVVSFAVLGFATVAGAADGARERTPEEIMAKLPAGNLMGDPDLRGPDTSWRDSNFVPPTSDLHPPRFDACKKYTDPVKFDADNPALASFENYDSTAPGRTGAYIFGVGGWATRGVATGGCGLSPGWLFGDIVAGIEARERPPTRAGNGIAQYGTGFQGSSSNGAVANFFVDSWGVWFDDPIKVQIPACPANGATPTAIRVGKSTSFFGAGNTNNTFTLTDGRQIMMTGTASPAGDFFGACCDVSIANIEQFSTTGQAEGYDEVSFGAKTTCVLPLAPVTLDDIHVSLEVLEAKIDASGGGGGGGGTR